MGIKGILQRFWEGLTRTTKPRNQYTVVDGYGVWVYVQCDRCGEKIKLRLRRTDELQRLDDGNGHAYYVRKIIVGNKCFNRIEADLTFDASYQIVESKVINGRLITQSEYNQSEDSDQ